jgi:hypothetical protein
VLVLLGDGTGGFGVPEAFPVGRVPGVLRLGDLNGDELLDLAVIAAFSNEVSLLYGDGDGGFVPVAPLPTPNGPDALALADLDGDGALDLAVASANANVVSVYLGDGTGGFAPRADFPTGPQPRSIAVADLNGDVVPDLAVADSELTVEGDDSVSVLLGDGSGGFGPHLSFGTGAAPASVAAGDLDGDARPDLVTVEAVPNTMTALLNVTGDPATVPGRPLIVSAAAGIEAVTLSWVAPTWDGGAALTGYVVTPFIGATAQEPVTFPSTVTTQTIGGLVGGTTYTFTVAATSALGTGAPSAASMPVTPTVRTVPSAPRTVRAAAGHLQATVSWQPPSSDGGSALTGYTVFVGTPGSYVPARVVSVGPAATAVTVTGLEAGAVHFFRVAAVNALGTGPYERAPGRFTIKDVAVPGPPGGVVAAPGNREAVVSWVPPSSDGGSALTGYTVFVGIPGSYVPAQEVSVGPTVTAVTITGLEAGAEHFFRVAAVNAIGTGPYQRAPGRITILP